MASIIGTSGNDVLTGTEEVDQIYGLAGDDQLTAVGDGDVLVGGAGGDTFVIDESRVEVTLSYEGSEQAVNLDYRLNDAPIYPDAVFSASGGDAEGDSIVARDSVGRPTISVIGSDGDDHITGDFSYVDGGAGADTIHFEKGEYLYRQSVLDYSSSDAGVQLDLNDGLGHGGEAEGDQISFSDDVHTVELRGTAFDDKFVALEDERSVIDSGAGDDILIGSSKLDQFDGGSGDDYMDGGGGNDTFVGGEGADYMLGGAGKNTLDYLASDAGVNVNLQTGEGSGGYAEGDTIHDFTVVSLSQFDDIATGTDGADTLFGRMGTDTIYGGDGDDRLNGETLYGGDGNDSMGNDADEYEGAGDNPDNYLNGGAGDDSVYADGVGHDILIGGDGDDWMEAGGDFDPEITGNATLWGGSGDDWLFSHDGGSDTLLGGSGDDTIYGGENGDVMDGGSGLDTLFVTTDPGNPITVDLAASEISGGHYENSTISNFENLTGSYGDDIFFGDDGRNVLYGGWGNDSLSGGGGDDLLQGLGDDDFLSGDDGRDRLEGGSGADYLKGGNGHDVLQGGDGNDVLEGGDGNDYLIGDVHHRGLASGADTFLWDDYEGGAERDRIVDFQADGSNADYIKLSDNFQYKSGITNFEGFINHAEQNDTGVYIDFANGAHYDYGVQIDGITIDDLDEDHVVFDDGMVVS
ncbi:calcium-binding protein [Thalassospira sp.]|uniref:calcium-binding protein n=1 Tax=Thalassospira sp. TaxID=1912094 RepID=UPI003AA95DEF